jgi:hypothetical protein
MVLVAICAATMIVLAESSIDGVLQRISQIVMAFVAVCSFTALLLNGVLAGAGAFIALSAHHVAFLRTLTICLVAVAIAFGGSRWRRSALTQLAYAALALVGLKLFIEDLRRGHMGFVAASIALFAVALMSVPRLVRLGVQRRAMKEIGRESTHARQISV